MLAAQVWRHGAEIYMPLASHTSIRAPQLQLDIDRNEVFARPVVHAAPEPHVRTRIAQARMLNILQLSLPL